MRANVRVMATEILSEQARADALAALPGWDVVDGKLHRKFEFADFPRAFAFMTQVAFAAEAKNHHPEWSNVYNRVEVWLTTHDAGGITEKDVELARVME